jgi:hypothetical protein
MDRRRCPADRKLRARCRGLSACRRSIVNRGLVRGRAPVRAETKRPSVASPAIVRVFQTITLAVTPIIRVSEGHAAAASETLLTVRWDRYVS